MEQDTKIKVGIILIIGGISALFILLIAAIYSPGIFISMVVTLTGYGFLLKGLSYRYRGLALIISGLFFIVPLIVTISLLTSSTVIIWADLFISIYQILIFFCILIFILPGTYLILVSFESANIGYHGRLLSWYVGITIMTLFSTTIVIVAGGVIASSRPGVDFRSFFLPKFYGLFRVWFIFWIIINWLRLSCG
ncbi:hypothetical protein LCGC14_1004740 [marine sediment metagenome]|uniref:Uncharacterized protein n=1 Tax=marine sediment metagenome TaxID=412755 RepID=A0A0F9R839_9ZZZZ|nr:hypothetical protein [archaeon]HEA70503.1 hypothetical protein [archaeon]